MSKGNIGDYVTLGIGDCDPSIPVDAAWLQEQGFSKNKMGLLVYGPLQADIHAVRTFGCALEWYVGGGNHAKRIPAPQCRRDVLDLMRLLVDRSET